MSSLTEAGMWRVGNLVYTRKGLFFLFFWLLWFDFSWTVLESVARPIIQFKLKNDLHANSLLFTLFLVTVPSILNFILNPIISISSDRHRGPRGRRIPFLMFGGPIVCVCLIALGFGHEIGAWLHASFFAQAEMNTVLIWTFGVLFLIFSVFNLFLTTTFYYLFNDVVPESRFVSFMSYMRVIGALASMAYSYFLFGYSNKTGPLHIDLGFIHIHDEQFWYPKLILVGIAVFYLITAGIALFKIKEPDYPPPPPLAKGDNFFTKTISAIRVVARESFEHRIYRLFFLTNMCAWMTGMMSQFILSSYVDMGIDMDRLGKLGTITGGVGLVLTIISARFGDRWHPLQIMIFSMVLTVASIPIGFIHLVPGLSADTYFMVAVVGAVLGTPIGVIGGMAESTINMSLLPRDRFGQFSAANAMIRMIFSGILGSIFAGWLMTVLESHYGNYAWRLNVVWGFITQAATLFCYILLYREFKRLGGREGYKPPMPSTSAPAA